MSKGEGKKIAIKFTEDLVGDVGNKDAFDITGKEYKYVDGPLVNKEYQVEKVERYPVQRIWELGGELQLDGPGEMAITDSKCYETAGGTTLTGTVNANAGDIVLATISHRSEFTTPSEWDKLYESTAVLIANQKMVFATKKVDAIGEVSFTATQSSSGRIYLSLISISGLTKIELAEEYEAYSTNAITSINVPNKTEGEKLIWGCSAPSWRGAGGLWSTSPNDLDIVSLPSNVVARQANFIDNGNGQATNRLFIPNAGTGTPLVVSAVSLIQEVGDTLKIHASQAIALLGEYRIRWQENKPQNTDILIEYTTGETQGQWQEVSNGDIINADMNLWIRATLSTEDAIVTPTLRDLWLEEASEPQDKILITMDQFDRFNNALGNIKVQYDSTKGTLQGRGGPVESFTEEFTPTGLVQKPNPGLAENFKMTAGAAVDLLKVEYNNRYAAENFKITAAATITLTFVGVINP